MMQSTVAASMAISHVAYSRVLRYSCCILFFDAVFGCHGMDFDVSFFSATATREIRSVGQSARPVQWLCHRSRCQPSISVRSECVWVCNY